MIRATNHDQRLTKPHRIVIVGGGAGGLELATRLGNRLGRKRRARVTLVDCARTHLWKPLLHEVAAGSMDLDEHDLDYLAQARWHHFEFQLGRMDGLDRARRVVRLAPTYDEENGEELIPRREIAYDTLVIAVGSRTNDFGTPGAREHAISLDTPEQAELFHRRLINACIRANAQTTPLRPEQLNVAIIGGGATGVELAAELHKTTRQLLAYGFEKIDPERDVRLTIIEAGPRILAAIPERVALAAQRLLESLNVKVLTGEHVTEVGRDRVRTATGREIPAEITVWAAGIKAPDFLKDLDGLEAEPPEPARRASRRCKRRAIRMSSRWATARAVRGRRDRACRRAPRPRTSRRRTLPGTSGGASRASRSSLMSIAISARWFRSANTAPSAISWGSSSADRYSWKAFSRASCMSRSIACTFMRCTGWRKSRSIRSAGFSRAARSLGSSCTERP